MSRPAHQYHDSDVRSMSVVPPSQRIAPMTDNQRWKLAAEIRAISGSKRWSEDSEENVKHGLAVARKRAFQYGRFVARRLSMCADRRRCRILLRVLRRGVGRHGSDLRVHFERGYASGVAQRC